MSAPDVAVVGGGLMGRLLAWQAARQGLRVELYEAGGRLGEESAAWAAAGMIAPGSEAMDASPEVVALGRRSLELWPQWLPELPVPVFYQSAGSLVLWGGDGEAEASQLAKEAGAQRIARAVLRELEPAIPDAFAEALYLPEEACIDNREALAALALGLEEAGVRCYWQARIADDALPEAKVLVDCRGMGAKQAAAGLRGVRGEILRLHAPELELKHMLRLLHGEKSVYVAPRAEGRLVIGATAYESEDRSPASVSGVMRLLGSAVSLLPALADAKIEEITTQVRPAFAHRQPVVEWDSTDRVLCINGLYRHGFLVSPAVVEKALTMITARQ